METTSLAPIAAVMPF